MFYVPTLVMPLTTAHRLPLKVTMAYGHGRKSPDTKPTDRLTDPSTSLDEKSMLRKQILPYAVAGS